LLLSFLTSFLWAANSITVKRGAEGLEVGQTNMIRCCFALAFLLPQVIWGEGKGRPAAPAAGWRAYLPAIAADSLVGGVCYVYGLAHTDLAVGATLVSLAPLVSVPVALATGVERWHPRRALAVTATVAGIVALVASGPGR
jgi:drug/metabolite transporter (DMT)-like permease